MKYLYLSVNLASAIIPFLFSFHPKLKFHEKFRFAFPAIVLTAAIFILWDIHFTDLGVWGFNKKYITGFYVFNLPVEEVLFFLCIPFSCLFTYYSINKLIRFRWRPGPTDITVSVFALSLLLTGFIFRNHLYTSSAFISTAILLAGINFMTKADWMGNFLTVYAVLIIPFFIVNGILTGSGPGEPVVWYNNHENTGVRILTIPIEDFIYGMELILLNVFLFEWFSSRRINAKGKNQPGIDDPAITG